MDAKKTLLTLFLSCALVAPALGAKRALLVGIDQYRYIEGFPQHDSKRDVSNMKAFLKDVWGYRDDEIRTLTDHAVTRENLLAGFNDWLVGETGPGDEVLFYFSGHGHYTPDKDGDEDDGLDEIITLYDTGLDKDNNAVNFVADDDIADLLSNLPDRRVKFIVDACHSGTSSRALQSKNSAVKSPIFKADALQRGMTDSLHRSMTEKSSPELAKEAHLKDGFIERPDNVIAFSAVTPNQKALIDIERRGGVFTNRFIDAIRDAKADRNADGVISYAEVLHYTRTSSQEYCEAYPRICEQGRLTPALEAPKELLAEDVRGEQAAQPAAPAAPDQGHPLQDEAENLFAQDNDARIRLETLPSERFRVGDTMRLRVKSDQGGYLTLFDINSRGETTRLFPNEYTNSRHARGLVEPGIALTIPDAYYGFAFSAEEPFGRGMLVALLSERPVELGATPLSKDLAPVPADPAAEALQDIRQQLNQVIIDAGRPDRPLDWSIATHEYEIVR